MTKNYINMKDSNFEWLKKIPSHWDLKKIKYVFYNLDSKRIPLSSEERGRMENKIYDYYGASGVIDKVENYIFDESLILIGEDGANLYSRSTPLAFVAKGKYWVNNHAHILKPKNGELYYWSNLLELIDYTIYITGSAQPKLTQDSLGNIIVPVPPEEEQKQIWGYLKPKLKEIDKLIFLKELLLSKLEQQRQAIITETVTKGLNPNVKMKDSGVEWIGEIPEHWNISKVKYEVEINKNTLADSTNPFYELEYIDIGSVDSKGQILQKEPYIFENAPSRARRIVKKGDTLISTVRTYLKAITTVDYQQDNLICSTGFAVLTPKKNIHPKYLGYVFKSTKYVDEIVSRSTGVSYPAINASEIGNLELIFPPYDEQLTSVKYLEDKIKVIDKIIKKIEIQISKLKEYRQSLIYEAVTGKIDVRDMKVD